jgi:hypothetical protein
MSYLLEFPPKPFPPGIRSPPYVIFNMDSVDISNELPQDIPLAMVLHFAPKMKDWVYPPPGELPRALFSHVLRKEPMGINIPVKIDTGALSFIVSKMMQVSGIAWKPEYFVTHPKLLVSIRTVEAWRALGLPEEGIRSLQMHIHTSLMMGGPVSLGEMNALWNSYSTSELVLREMAQNFIRAHLDFAYKMEEYRAIQAWIQCDNERKKYFAGFDGYNKIPVFSEGQTKVLKADVEKSMAAPRMLKRGGTVIADTKTGIAGKSYEILYKAGTEKVSPQERREREQQDVEEMRRKLRRLKSDESIRSVDTVIYNPQPTPPKQEEEVQPRNERPEGSKKVRQQPHPKSTQEISHETSLGAKTDYFSKPVDGNLLAKALEKYAKLLESDEDGALDEQEKSNK